MLFVQKKSFELNMTQHYKQCFSDFLITTK